LHHAHLLAEAQNNAQLVRFNPEETGKSPERKRTKDQESKTAPAEVAAG
jgi:hypothetical protein